ncbi:MAG: hypothetical protein M3340_14230, partial [Actinomycetota bacterium]|nr:hypothetical protein [Actinomycetota bacterium]
MLAVALVLSAAALAGGSGAARELSPYQVYKDPGSESARVGGRVERALGIDPRSSLVALVETPSGA